MKIKGLFIGLLLSALFMSGGGYAQDSQQAAPPAPAQENSMLKTDADKLSYALGVQWADYVGRFKSEGLNLDLLKKGLDDAAAKAPLAMTEEEMMGVFKSLKERLMSAREAQGKKAGEAGLAFLDQNAKAEGVKVLPSGLQYKVIKDGEGASPKATDTVSVHYRGTLTTGEEFDSSIKRGQPATFPVNGVIKGWTEALQLMKVGSKWQLFIPAALGYGSNGAPDGSIPPNATLLFDVELLGIK